METYNFCKEDLEENYDSAKVAVIRSLVLEGYMDSEEAEEWCRTHTIILRRKNVFRTLSNLWQKTEKSKSGHYILVVKTPKAEDKEEDEGEREPSPIDEPTPFYDTENKIVKLRG